MTTVFRLNEDGLSVRASNALKNAVRKKGEDTENGYVVSVAQAARMSRCELKREANCGKKTLAEIEQWLAARGLELQP